MTANNIQINNNRKVDKTRYYHNQEKELICNILEIGGPESEFNFLYQDTKIVKPFHFQIDINTPWVSSKEYNANDSSSKRIFVNN